MVFPEKWRVYMVKFTSVDTVDSYYECYISQESKHSWNSDAKYYLLSEG
jgi:hypothetical protein